MKTTAYIGSPFFYIQNSNFLNSNQTRLLPSKGARTLALSSDCKIGRLILLIGCFSYHLTSYRKSVLIQKASAQVPKAFHQHGKMI